MISILLVESICFDGILWCGMKREEESVYFSVDSYPQEEFCVFSERGAMNKANNKGIWSKWVLRSHNSNRNRIIFSWGLEMRIQRCEVYYDLRWKGRVWFESVHWWIIAISSLEPKRNMEWSFRPWYMTKHFLRSAMTN